MKLRLTFRMWSLLVDCGQIADARMWVEQPPRFNSELEQTDV